MNWPDFIVDPTNLCVFVGLFHNATTNWLTTWRLELSFCWSNSCFSTVDSLIVFLHTKMPLFEQWGAQVVGEAMNESHTISMGTTWGGGQMVAKWWQKLQLGFLQKWTASEQKGHYWCTLAKRVCCGGDWNMRKLMWWQCFWLSAFCDIASSIHHPSSGETIQWMMSRIWNRPGRAESLLSENEGYELDLK